MRTITRKSVALWTLQALLASLFLFAGGMKLVLPTELLTQGTTLSGAFLRFIGVAEVLGALGLMLPQLLRIRPVLTPIAAAALAIMMVGAVATTWPGGGIGAAWVPLLTGILLLGVVRGRWRGTRPSALSYKARRENVRSAQTSNAAM